MQESTSKHRLVQSVVLTGFGGFDKIEIKPTALPDSCEKEDVEVKIKFCGVNFADIYIRKGLLPHIQLPYTLGLECVGIVERVGEQVSKLKPGDRVLCYKGDGGLYRETVILNQKFCVFLPDFVEDITAVSLPANYLTAYFSLFDIGNLQPGQKVLIHTCAGGVGWAATQLAKSVENVVVVGTTSKPHKYEIVKENGVDHVIPSLNYLTELKRDENLKNFSFDIIIDSLGGSNVKDSMSLLNTCGKVVVIGANHMINGEQKISILQLLRSWWNTKPIPIVDLIVKNCVVAGLHLANIMENSPEKVYDALNCLFQMYEEKKIIPRIDSKFSLHEVTNAMKRLADRENIGKVVIEVHR